MLEDVEAAISGVGIVASGLSTDHTIEVSARHVSAEQGVFNLANMQRRDALRGKVMGLCW